VTAPLLHQVAVAEHPSLLLQLCSLPHLLRLCFPVELDTLCEGRCSKPQAASDDIADVLLLSLLSDHLLNGAGLL